MASSTPLRKPQALDAPDNRPAVLEFENIRQDFRQPTGTGKLRVLDGISFTVPQSSFVAVIGPSGCGKSTLLNMAAGLLAPTEGTVRHSGSIVSGLNRQVGLVPQQAQLFPWKTLRQNVELPLILRNVNRAERETRVANILAAVGLQGFEDHYPRQLSGGMQKRGSIARTLVYSPDVILMDEPFGALDAQTRMIMQDDLQKLATGRRSTILFITHDITEAVLLADMVVVLSYRPTHVIDCIPSELPRPRNVFEPFRTPGFEETYDRIWSVFRSQVIDGARQ
jgi:ABC-type nitrate/sulfonate/bicarbonate transport system ATPase subunit